jgi:hypothetical protein
MKSLLGLFLGSATEALARSFYGGPSGLSARTVICHAAFGRCDAECSAADRERPGAVPVPILSPAGIDEAAARFDLDAEAIERAIAAGNVAAAVAHAERTGAVYVSVSTDRESDAQMGVFAAPHSPDDTPIRTGFTRASGPTAASMAVRMVQTAEAIWARRAAAIARFPAEVACVLTHDHPKSAACVIARACGVLTAKSHHANASYLLATLKSRANGR